MLGFIARLLAPEFRELIRWPLKLEVHVAPPEQ